MSRRIKMIQGKDRLPSLELVEQVFTDYKDQEEGRMVRALVEEIRNSKYYLPQLELLMVDERDTILGYVMFSRFHIEGRYEDRLLLLTPAAVRTDLQRQHISKELIEYGFERAREMGFQAVLVEGDPRNYTARGFEPSYLHNITAGPNIRLPHPDCLMVKELVPGGLRGIEGEVDYSFYKALTAGG